MNENFTPIWLTTTTTQKLLGLSYYHVRGLLESGELPSRRIGKCRLIHRDDVSRLMQSPAAIG